MGGSERVPFDLCERTFQFAVRVVKLCRELDQTPGVSRNLAEQLLRSGTSVGANVEEGQAGQSRADFVAKYSISLKESRETRYWMRLLDASEVCNSPEVRSLMAESEELGKILATIIKKARPH